MCPPPTFSGGSRKWDRKPASLERVPSYNSLAGCSGCQSGMLQRGPEAQEVTQAQELVTHQGGRADSETTSQSGPAWPCDGVVLLPPRPGSCCCSQRSRGMPSEWPPHPLSPWHCTFRHRGRDCQGSSNPIVCCVNNQPCSGSRLGPKASAPLWTII